MFTSLLVLTRILANPLSNVFQKRLAAASANPLIVILVTHALLSVVALPIWLYVRPAHYSGGFWPDMWVAVMLAVAGNAVLVQALETGDLSVLGPINAYKAVVGLALGVVLLREVPTARGIAGVGLIVAGSYFVVGRATPSAPPAFVRFWRDRGIRLRLVALVLSAVEAVFLKRALLRSSPLSTFLLWSLLGVPVSLAAALVLPRIAIGEEIRKTVGNRSNAVLLAATTGLMQVSTLFTFGRLPVGYSLALFQTSAIVSVLLGRTFFQEQNIGRRLSGAAIMIAGVVLVATAGT